MIKNRHKHKFFTLIENLGKKIQRCTKLKKTIFLFKNKIKYSK